MAKEPLSRLIMMGGASGIAGTVCYIAAITFPLNSRILYLLAMAWPILLIIFSFTLYQYIGNDRQSAANHLAFLFACLGFTLVACMLSVQLAVVSGTEEYINDSPDRKEFLILIRRSARLVDHGIDVAWDVFIGTSLIFLSVALKGHRRFGLWWGIPSALLGILLMAINVSTFPWPPYTRGLLDVGPGVGIYIIALGARLVWIGKHL